MLFISVVPVCLILCTMFAAALLTASVFAKTIEPFALDENIPRSMILDALNVAYEYVCPLAILAGSFALAPAVLVISRIASSSPILCLVQVLGTFAAFGLATFVATFIPAALAVGAGLAIRAGMSRLYRTAC